MENREKLDHVDLWGILVVKDRKELLITEMGLFIHREDHPLPRMKIILRDIQDLQEMIQDLKVQKEILEIKVFLE